MTAWHGSTAAEPVTSPAIAPDAPTDGRDELSELHSRPGHLIRRCQQIAVALFLDCCAGHDLTPVQYAVLKAVAASGTVDQTSLAGQVALDRSTVGTVIDRLATRGLLERTVSPTDRRVRHLAATPAGRRVLDAIQPAVDRTQERLLAPLTPEERTALLSALGKIAASHNEASRAPLRISPTATDR